MFSCLQILEAFLWFVLITLLNVTLIILTLSVSRLLNLLLRLVAFLLFFTSRRRHTISDRDWSSDVCSSDLGIPVDHLLRAGAGGGQPFRERQPSGRRQRLSAGPARPHARRERAHHVVRAPPWDRARERAARRGRGPHPRGRLHHGRHPRRHPAHATGVVVGGFDGGDPRRPGDRPRGVSHPRAHGAGARGPARHPHARYPGCRPGRPGREKRLRDPLARALRPAVRRGDGVRRPSRGRGVRARHRRPGGGAAQARPAAARSHGARRAMLSLSGEQRSRTTRRPPRSLKQEYQEFLLQRIEEYKNALTRADLLEIGDEAVRELEESAAGQYLLTEVLLLEHVDRIIARRLRLPSFPRWRQKHRALRAAQRAPTHWGLEPDGLLVNAVRRLEPGDLAVVVGAAALPAALFIAARDAEVFLVDHDLAAVEGAESRAVTEQLAGRFQALVVTFGSWFPDVAPSLVIIDPAALAPARARDRHALLAELQLRTRPGGVHVILPSPAVREVIPLAPEALQSQYGGWEGVRRRRGKASAGFTATKPERQLDTALNVSE